MILDYKLDFMSCMIGSIVLKQERRKIQFEIDQILS